MRDVPGIVKELRAMENQDSIDGTYEEPFEIRQVDQKHGTEDQLDDLWFNMWKVL